MKHTILKFVTVVIFLSTLTGCNSPTDESKEGLKNTRKITGGIAYLSNEQYFLEEGKVIWKLPSNITPYRERIMEKAHLDTSEVFFRPGISDSKNETPYARDKKFGYYEGEVIEGSHGASFELLNNIYAKDKQFGYYSAKKIEGSDGLTFELIKDEKHYMTHFYATDKYSVYFNGSKLKGSDRKTFEYLKYDYVKDTDNISLLSKETLEQAELRTTP